MAKTNPSVVLLKGDPIYKELPLEPLDIYGVGSIVPGMLCVRTATNTVKPHATSAGAASAIFAVEALAFASGANASKTQGGIDDPYDEDGQSVKLAYCKPGDEIYALLAAGAGNDTTGAGVLLESNGHGYLKVGSTSPVARSLEDVDNDPGTNSLPKRVRVEVL